MLVKTKEESRLLLDLETVFNCLRHHNMRLTPINVHLQLKPRNFWDSCTHWGFEANPDKRRAILEMKSPIMIKEVQHLTGRIASLSRFKVASA